MGTCREACGGHAPGASKDIPPWGANRHGAEGSGEGEAPATIRCHYRWTAVPSVSGSQAAAGLQAHTRAVAEEGPPSRGGMDHDPRRGSGCQAGVARSRGWILAPCAEAPKGEEAEEGEEEEGAGRRGTGLMVLVNRLARLEDF